MNLILYPDEAIQIIAQGKNKESIVIWIDSDGRIHHKLQKD